MAVPRGYGLNGKSLFTNVTKPMYTWLTFTVTPTNGLGVTSVKSNGYANYVFMHTSTTPTANNGITNPNPPNGYAVIGLKNSFNYFLGMRGSVAVPATNTGTTSTTANTVYTITALGSATAAQWQAVGLPSWITPAVGQTFVATASQSIGGSATVGTAGVTNIGSIAVVGDPNATISSSNVASYGGAYLVLQFAALSASGTVSQPTLTMNSYTPAGTITNGTPDTFAGTPAVLTGTVSTPTFTSTAAAAAAAPTTGSIITLELCFDGSSVTVDGI